MQIIFISPYTQYYPCAVVALRPRLTRNLNCGFDLHRIRTHLHDVHSPYGKPHAEAAMLFSRSPNHFAGNNCA